MVGDFIRTTELVIDQHNARAWPAPQWQADLPGFAEQFLAYRMWERQIEIAAIVREHLRVAIASGHRIGKALALDTPIPTPTGWTTMGGVGGRRRRLRGRWQPDSRHVRERGLFRSQVL